MNIKTSGYRKFLLLWTGELVSSIGSGLTSFGLTVYIFNQTGSAASTSLIALLAFLPTLLLGLPAGVLADRMDRRLLMMFGDGMTENIVAISITGFAFFAMLPFANAAFDYLIRTNTANEVQGRVWGLVGFISQLGYVVAYATCGLAADRIAKYKGVTVGRGSATAIMMSGVMLTILSVILFLLKSIKKLETSLREES